MDGDAPLSTPPSGGQGQLPSRRLLCHSSGVRLTLHPGGGRAPPRPSPSNGAPSWSRRPSCPLHQGGKTPCRSPLSHWQEAPIRTPLKLTRRPPDRSPCPRSMGSARRYREFLGSSLQIVSADSDSSATSSSRNSGDPAEGRPAKVLRRWLANAELPGPALRVVSACSGLGTECFALHRLGQKFTLLSSCDVAPAMRAFCEMNHAPKTVFHDCCTDEWVKGVPAADLLVAGFPCQPFSVAGVHGGELDPRGTVIWWLLKWIRRAQPACVLLENVPGLVSCHPETLLNILEALQSIRLPGAGRSRYSVRWKILNSADFGLPQNRRRLYIVAARPDVVRWPFRWPEGGREVSLTSVLEAAPRTTTRQQIAAARPRAQRAARLVENVVRLLTAAGVDPVRACAVIDAGGTKGCWNLDRLPCLTATRGSTGGFWLTNRGRFTTSLELMRCQGFKPCENGYLHAQRTPVGESPRQRYER